MVHRASGRSNAELRYEEADLCRCAGAVYNADTAGTRRTASKQGNFKY